MRNEVCSIASTNNNLNLNLPVLFLFSGLFPSRMDGHRVTDDRDFYSANGYVSNFIYFLEKVYIDSTSVK